MLSACQVGPQWSLSCGFEGMGGRRGVNLGKVARRPSTEQPVALTRPTNPAPTRFAACVIILAIVGNVAFFLGVFRSGAGGDGPPVLDQVPLLAVLDQVPLLDPCQW